MSLSVQTDSSRRLWWFAAAGALAALAAIVLLHLRLLPTGLPGEWEWQWRVPPLLAWPLWIALAMLVALALAIWSYLLSAPRLSRAAAAAGTAGSCLVAATLLLLITFSQPLPPLHLASVTASVPAMGYLGFATVKPDARQMMDHYVNPPGVEAAPGRVGTHPPGPAFFFLVGRQALLQQPGLLTWLERTISDNWELTPQQLYDFSRWYVIPTTTPDDLLIGIILGALVTMLGSLLPVPAYFIGAALGGRRQGLIAAILVTLIPSFVVFVPTIEGVAALLGLAAVALWLQSCVRRSPCAAAVAGLAMGLALFWTAGLAVLAVPMLCLVLPLGTHQEQSGNLRSLLRLVLPALGTFVALYLLLFFATGYNLLANLRQISEAQRYQMDLAQRSYLAWLPLNLYDTVLFMGPVLVALLANQLWRLRQLPTLQFRYALGALAAFVLVWLSGSTLGEVGRIWLFLMALLAIIPTWQLSRLSPTSASRLLTLTALTQCALSLALHSTLSLIQPG